MAALALGNKAAAMAMAVVRIGLGAIFSLFSSFPVLSIGSVWFVVVFYLFSFLPMVISWLI